MFTRDWLRLQLTCKYLTEHRDEQKLRQKDVNYHSLQALVDHERFLDVNSCGYSAGTSFTGNVQLFRIGFHVTAFVNTIFEEYRRVRHIRGYSTRSFVSILGFRRYCLGGTVVNL